MSKWLSSRYLIALLIISLCGCGFHLRGTIDIPPWLNNVALIEQGHHELKRLLQDQLQAYKIKMNDDPMHANYWLFIDSESIQQQITSISSSTTPRQYQLIYTVRFHLQTKNGKKIVRASQIIVTRQITMNSDRILGSDEEENVTKQEMRLDAATQILSRIRLATSI